MAVETRVERLNMKNARAAAALMGRLKPEWWSEADAFGQLTDIGASIATAGWVLREGAAVKGFALFRELKGYRTLELECCGFDDGGVFKLEHKLGDIFSAAYEYARAKACVCVRSGMSSVGFNIHNRPLGEIGAEITGLSAPGREDYAWYLSQGFAVSGIVPNVYGEGRHLVILCRSVGD